MWMYHFTQELPSLISTFYRSKDKNWSCIYPSPLLADKIHLYQLFLPGRWEAKLILETRQAGFPRYILQSDSSLFRVWVKRFPGVAGSLGMKWVWKDSYHSFHINPPPQKKNPPLSASLWIYFQENKSSDNKLHNNIPAMQRPQYLLENRELISKTFKKYIIEYDRRNRYMQQKLKKRHHCSFIKQVQDWTIK